MERTGLTRQPLTAPAHGASRGRVAPPSVSDPFWVRTAGLLAGRFAGLAISFVALAVIARGLGPASLGLLQFSLAVFFYVGFMNDPGLSTLGAREYAARGRPPRLVGEIVGARATLTAAAGLVLGIGATLLSLDARELLLVAVLGSTLVASAFNLSWLVQGSERFKALAVVEVIAAVAQLGAAMLLVHGPDDVVAAAVTVAAAAWGATAASWIAVRPTAEMRPRVSVGTARLVLHALPLGMAALATAVYYTVDSLLLGMLRTSSEVGYYAAAYRLVLPQLAVAVASGTVALPLMARVLANRAEEITTVLATMSRGLMLLALPAAVGTALLASPLVTVVYGDAYGPAALPLSVLAWSCVTVFANAPFGFLMIARRQHHAYMAVAGTGAAVNLVANLVLIPPLGMAGAAFATLGTEAVVLALMLWFTRDVFLRPLGSAFATASPAAVIMAIAIWPWRDSIAAVPIGIVTYAAAAVLTGALPLGWLDIERWRKTPVRARHEMQGP